MSVYSCIACDKDRTPGSGFCAAHKTIHNKSPWVKAWREYQKEVAKVGVKDASWVAPKGVKNEG